jgi:phospho-N-acetylmuramoyl-pentapeptide-transferase
MERILIAAIVALVVSIVVGPKFIEFLRRKELGQYIREEGPAGHVAKAGTPTAGGVLILVATTLAFLAFSRYSTAGLTVLFATVACGAIGFLDDYIKLTHQRSLGLPGRWKLLLLVGVAAAVGYLAHRTGLSTDVYLPLLNVTVNLSYAWYVLVFFVIAGAANGVNLADGIDGLAAGTGLIAIFTFTVISVFTYIRSGQPAFGAQSIPHLDLAIVGGALIGATIGFLWYNAFPAEVIMGDTGAFAIGGALGAFAIMLKAETLLLLIGGIFVIEALSVMLQVFTFKYMGRRIFLMAPIHHHFEMKAWSETKIMVRFWIVTGILCAAGFAFYYRYFPDFFGTRR